MISIDKCIENALERLKPMPYNKTVMDIECSIYVWPQTWGDTTCGRGGFGGQMITSTSTVVVVGPNQDACVYHGGSLACKIDCINEKFWKAIDNRKLPGKMERHEWAKLSAKGRKQCSKSMKANS